MNNLEQKAEEALNNLAGSDYEHARAKAYLNSLQEQRKSIKALMFIDTIQSEHCSQGIAEQKAYASKRYQDHLDNIAKAELEFQKLQNNRVTWIQTIELYRTHSANQRRGNA